jgi:hypothetical protein
MSATISNREFGLDENRRTITADITIGEYATGGVAVDLNDLGLTTVEEAWLSAVPETTGIVVQVDLSDTQAPLVTAQYFEEVYEVGPVESEVADEAELNITRRIRFVGF